MVVSDKGVAIRLDLSVFVGFAILFIWLGSIAEVLFGDVIFRLSPGVAIGLL